MNFGFISCVIVSAWVIAFNGSVHGNLLGGATAPETPKWEKINGYINDVKGDILSKCGFGATQHMTGVKYLKQLVNGMNYFVKIKVGNDDFVVARIYVPFNGQANLSGLKRWCEEEPVKYIGHSKQCDQVAACVQ